MYDVWKEAYLQDEEEDAPHHAKAPSHGMSGKSG